MKSSARPQTATEQAADEGRSAQRGQVIILFALFLTSMLGMVGLATDLGFAFVQRRSMQNAADAAAMAGAWSVARWTPLYNISAAGEVEARARDNGMGAATPQVIACDYVNDADQSVGSCAASVPALATGVKVTVREEHPTFFIQIVPGAPNRVTTEATATAHVQRIRHIMPNSPFLICGKDTTLVSGGKLSILTDNNTINPAAVGQTFLIHGPSKVADCGLKSGMFKGLADQDLNQGKLPGMYWSGTEGDKAGPTRQKVSGVEGCANNAPEPFNCVMIVPIFTDNPAPQKIPGSPELYVVLYAAFKITGVGANTHTGVLLDDYIDPDTVWGLPHWAGSNGWNRDAGGVVVVRLTA